MTALPLARKKFTPEEYLLVERAAETKSEMLDGEIYAMSGASREHVTITDNLTVEVGAQVKGTSCQGMSQDMKVPAGDGGLYAYPDYLIVCGEQKFRDGARDVLVNPLVIFEVLSPSTEQYDRVTKFDLYKQVDSLKEYVLISQDSPRVEIWQRLDDASWRQQVVVGRDRSFSLSAAPVTLSLANLYDRVDFPRPSQ